MAKRIVSEYGGGGVMPNTVYPKGSDALTPADKLRLDSITGQDQDARAPVDPYHWMGGVKPEAVLPGKTDAEIFSQGDRYTELPN